MGSTERPDELSPPELEVSGLVWLVVSSDDYLLEEALRDAVRTTCAELGDVDPEVLGDEITPEDLAVELCSPSLFTPQRVLVVPDVRAWVDVPARRQPAARPAAKATVDAAPVVRVLDEGLADGIGVVMGALCHSKPKGQLVKAVQETGQLRWQPAPEPPKPWEDAILSTEQEALLRDILARTAGDVRFTPEASRLLLERLGFAPRLLVQEARKLAAGADGVVDEERVLALSFPRERSLEVVSDGILSRQAAPVLDLLAAADAGIQVRDRQGRTVTSKGVLQIVFNQVSAMLLNLLYLRRLASEHGLLEEMALERTREDRWYPKHFKNRVGPRVMELATADAPSPLVDGGRRKPTLFTLGKLFKGAGRYLDDELVEAVADLGDVETALRGDMGREALAVWLTSFLH